MTWVKLMVAATHGKNYGLRYQNEVMASDSFACRKTKSCRQHGLLFWGWRFYSSVCVCWAVAGSDATKIIQCKIIYKNAKMSWTNNAKIATGNWNTYLAEHYRVDGRDFVEMQLLRRVFGLWTGRLLWTIHLVQGGLRSTIWRALSYFVENCLVTA